MCGIVGAFAVGKLPKEQEEIRQEVMRYLTTELMIETEERGKDATGAAILFNSGHYYGIKRGDRATKFINLFGTDKDCYGSLLKLWRNTKSPGKAFIGHCRATTVGKKHDNNNNHPIKVRNIIGVHNGTLDNADEIFENLGCHRDGEVDSEAIMRLAYHFTDEGKEPFTMEVMEEIIHRLEGSYAVMMFNADNPYQIPVFRDSRPMEFVFIKKLGILIIVSDTDFWNAVHCQYERSIQYHGNDLPSLIGEFETKTLIHGEAAIFDLTTVITDKTTINDLAEWKKVGSFNKIWKSPPKYARTTYTGGNHHVATPPKTVAPNKKEEPPVQKSFHIFDEVARRYIVQSGDKKTDTTIAYAESKDIVVKSQSAKKDKTKTAELNDLTVYNQKFYKDEKDQPKEEKDPPKIEKQDDVKLITVDMTQESPELLKIAADVYELLPIEDRGYETIDELLDATGIKTLDDMLELGHVFLGSRLFNAIWPKGFVIGYKYALSQFDNSEKIERREQHIIQLKALVILLTKFFNNQLGDIENVNIRKQLLNVIFAQNTKINIDSLKPIFHAWENKELAIVTDILKRSEE